MKSEIVWRVGIVYILMTILAVLIVMKALHVQMWEGKEWRDKAGSVRVRDFEVAPNRGDICATDGRILASSVPYYELHVDWKVVSEEVFRTGVDSLALCLSNFFKDESVASYKKRLKIAKNPRNRYYLLNKRKVSYNELQEIKKFPIFRLGKNKGGLIEVMNSDRLQPHKDLATRTIGYLNNTESSGREGRVGIEGAFENELKGIPGRSVKQMMSGTWEIGRAHV